MARISSRTCFVLALSVFVSKQIAADERLFEIRDLAGMPPIEILYGAYQILGKEPGPLGESYHAWVRIAVEDNRLLMDRCFNGKRSEGSGHLTAVSADKLPAIRFKFRHGDEAREATCTYQNDFDNLPRFTCYTYPEGEPAIAVPGLEAFFPIIWPVSLEFFDCR